jgi:hypothetical protein
VNLISLKRGLKSVISGEIFFWEAKTGTGIAAKTVVDYNAIQKFLTEKISVSLHFTQKRINLLDPSRNISEEEITVALQEIDHDFISVKQMTAKRLT